jgi:hypothetical protein
MEHESWPTPQSSGREPLPRVEDLPLAEQGYEQESVKAAFDSFYRHAAQLDAALRTLEAVDSFHRQAAALRSDLRALRAGGWTQQSWQSPPSYGYDVGSTREGVSPALWRVGGEVLFLIAVAVALGVAQLSWWVVLLVMAGAFAIVCIIEWLAARDQYSFARPAESAAPVLPVVEAMRVEDTEEDALGWTAFEEAQEPSDAMTIIGAPPREEPEAEAQVEVEPVAEEAPPEPEPDPEPVEEPELPPAAEEDEERVEGRRRWWHREDKHEVEGEVAADPEPPRHVRVLPADEASSADPWEQGFDAAEGAPEEPLDHAGEPDEETEEPLLLEEPERRRFRRR